MRIPQEDKFRFLDQAPCISKMRALMGMRGKDCAKMFKVDTPTWSRMENGFHNNDVVLSSMKVLYKDWVVEEEIKLMQRIEYLKSIIK